MKKTGVHLSENSRYTPGNPLRKHRYIIYVGSDPRVTESIDRESRLRRRFVGASQRPRQREGGVLNLLEPMKEVLGATDMPMQRAIENLMAEFIALRVEKNEDARNSSAADAKRMQTDSDMQDLVAPPFGKVPGPMCSICDCCCTLSPIAGATFSRNVRMQA